jgi:predicted nucleic acid-binding protein
VKLFVDSSGWIGLFAKADKYHLPAVAAFNKIEGSKTLFITSDYVIDESLTYIKKTYGRHNALRFGQWVLATDLVEIHHVDEEMWQLAWQMFQEYDDKKWAFTDCTSFALMRQHNLWQAFAFDHHFEQAGFQRWPKIEGI